MFLNRRLFLFIVLIFGFISSIVHPCAYSGDNALLVSAAASLTDVLKAVGAAYMADHPDARIDFNFAASGALLRQIQNGAPVDVYVTADRRFMDDAEKQELIIPKSRADFAGNRLVLAGPADGPSVSSLERLRKP